ncbi:hypothetical protein Y1Q_0017770 [Alligator mississippiensis]|uniref:Uncharacterized protein n=1 Tax=Alligator mississippiensis TaxID=8496 RepID=A0A151MJF3_ALLMI|nr:hypothetical protein Y1Q_0017770 [Alligator mississippiensis]
MPLLNPRHAAAGMPWAVHDEIRLQMGGHTWVVLGLEITLHLLFFNSVDKTYFWRGLTKEKDQGKYNSIRRKSDLHKYLQMIKPDKQKIHK